MGLLVEESLCICVDSTSCDPMYDPCDPPTDIWPLCPHPVLQTRRGKQKRMYVCMYDTIDEINVWYNPSPPVRRLIYIFSESDENSLKSVFCTDSTQLTPNQNKGGYPVFPEPTPSQNSTAWQGGCYRSYRSLHYNGRCGEETSLIVLSGASFQTGGLKWSRGSHVNGITAVLLPHCPPH